MTLRDSQELLGGSMWLVEASCASVWHTDCGITDKAVPSMETCAKMRAFTCRLRACPLWQEGARGW